MKKYKILLTLGLFLTLFSITSCNMDTNKNDDKDINASEYVKAYRITYNDFVGFVELKTNNSLITYIRIDEAFMPDVWAKETEKDALTDVVMKDEENKYLEGELGYAKYIKIGDKVFTGTLYTEEELIKNESKKQKIKYSAPGITDLYTYLKTETNAKWYVECLQKGEAYVCSKDGKAVDDTKFNVMKSYFKSSSLYWTTGESGWAKNIQYLCNAVVGTKVNEEITMVDGYVKIGEVVTSATMVAYQDYYDLIKMAYKKVK